MLVDTTNTTELSHQQHALNTRASTSYQIFRILFTFLRHNIYSICYLLAAIYLLQMVKNSDKSMYYVRGMITLEVRQYN